MIFHSTYSKPILLVGNGVRTSGAVDLLHEFALKTNIPILTTMNGVDLAQDNLHIGFIGTHGNRIANIILNSCDLIISIGARLGLRQVGRISKNFAMNAKLIRVDIDEHELSRNIKYDEIKVNMDAKDFLINLLKEDVPDYYEWKMKCFSAKKIFDQYDKTEGNFAVEKISSLLPINPIVAIDVGQHQCWSAQSLHLKGLNGRILIGGGYGTMGCGLPYAIGASISQKKKPVFVICGDGGFQMNIQELETLKRENLPIKIFVLNNKVLGKISETQHLNHNDRFAQTTAESGYSVPDFVKIAEAYGIESFNIPHYTKIDEYSAFLKDEKPHLFNISLSSESFLIPKIQWKTGDTIPVIKKDILNKITQVLK